MSDHAHKPGDSEHAHPGAKEYTGIAIVLTVITAIEVAVFYIPAMHPFLVPLLLTLSAIKFGIVVMWYMHLKFDNKLFSVLFFLGMGIAIAITLALMKLFGQY